MYNTYITASRTQYRKQENCRIPTIQEAGDTIQEAGQLYNTYITGSRRHNTGSRTIVEPYNGGIRTIVHYLRYRKQEVYYRKQDNCTIPRIQEAGDKIQEAEQSYIT